MEGETRGPTVEDLRTFVRVCVCVCMRAHMCRNHQVPTCVRIKETFDKWSISLEPLWNLLEIALSTDDSFLEDQGRDQVD